LLEATVTIRRDWKAKF